MCSNCPPAAVQDRVLATQVCGSESAGHQQQPEQQPLAQQQRSCVEMLRGVLLLLLGVCERCQL